MRAQPSRRAGADPAAVGPGPQRARGGLQRADERRRVEQAGVLAAVRRAVEVLARQAQAQVAGEDAGTVAVSAGVAGLPFVEGGVEDGAGELAVVRPRAAVEVV